MLGFVNSVLLPKRYKRRVFAFHQSLESHIRIIEKKVPSFMSWKNCMGIEFVLGRGLN